MGDDSVGLAVGDDPDGTVVELDVELNDPNSLAERDVWRCRAVAADPGIASPIPRGRPSESVWNVAELREMREMEAASSESFKRSAVGRREVAEAWGKS